MLLSAGTSVGLSASGDSLFYSHKKGAEYDEKDDQIFRHAP